MIYKVNEIFTSVKGEGVWLGTPMHFIRLAKCNLVCDHCDTQFNEPVTEMSEEMIVNHLSGPINRVVITGGEPTLQNLEPLLKRLWDCNFSIHLESNGTRPFPNHFFSWVCISPKLWFGEPLRLNVELADEIKMPVRDESDIEAAEKFRAQYNHLLKPVWYLHPWNDEFVENKHGTDLGPGARDMRGFSKRANDLCVQHSLRTNRWRVSVQIHKMLEVR